MLNLSISSGSFCMEGFLYIKMVFVLYLHFTPAVFISLGWLITTKGLCFYPFFFNPLFFLKLFLLTPDRINVSSRFHWKDLSPVTYCRAFFNSCITNQSITRQNLPPFPFTYPTESWLYWIKNLKVNLNFDTTLQCL